MFIQNSNYLFVSIIIKIIYKYYDEIFQLNWLVFNANFSSISAILWHGFNSKKKLDAKMSCIFHLAEITQWTHSIYYAIFEPLKDLNPTDPEVFTGIKQNLPITILHYFKYNHISISSEVFLNEAFSSPCPFFFAVYFKLWTTRAQKLLNWCKLESTHNNNNPCHFYMFFIAVYFNLWTM